VCVNAEGQCHIFDITSSNESAPTSNDEKTPAMRPIIISSQKVIKPTLTLSVHVNCNRILIADIGMINYWVEIGHNYNDLTFLFYILDGDGINEIILARTDRILHVFNFQSPPPPVDSMAINKTSQPSLEEKKKWHFDGQVKIMRSSTFRSFVFKAHQFY
jgi:hypothetical protein